MRRVFLAEFLILASAFIFSCGTAGKPAVSRQADLKKEVEESKKYLYSYVKEKQLSGNLSVKREIKVEKGRVKPVDKEVKIRNSMLLEKDLQKLNKRELEKRMVDEPPVPIVVPPKVVRVLIFPYIDDRGNLHSESYVFFELRKARWVVGEYGKGELYGKRMDFLGGKR